MVFSITNSPVTIPEGSNINGPLADLNQTSFGYTLYQYPTVNDAQSSGHQIVFFINIPQQSYWNNASVTNSHAPAPVANRLGAASNFALRNVGSNQALGTPGQNLMNGQLGSSLEQYVLQSNTVRTTTAIGLYIPPTMIYTQNMEYENVSLSGALGVVGDLHAAIELFQQNSTGLGLTALGGLIPDAIRHLTSSVGITTQGGLRDSALKGAGIADNPQNFLLFKQIDFRKFVFEFILTPENPSDTVVINQIINLFKFHSAPEVLTGTSGRFFVPPSEFDIQIMYKGTLNPNIPLINTCVCTNVSVNYAVAGKWVTYTDGMPVMTKLSLAFTETQILTKDLVKAGF